MRQEGFGSLGESKRPDRGSVNQTDNWVSTCKLSSTHSSWGLSGQCKGGWRWGQLGMRAEPSQAEAPGAWQLQSKIECLGRMGGALVAQDKGRDRSRVPCESWLGPSRCDLGKRPILSLGAPFRPLPKVT
jgi:hypothetical protein